MSFVIYIAVVLAGLVSVMLGLQLASAPPPARTAAQPQLVEPIRHAPTLPSAKPAVPSAAATPANPPVYAPQQAAAPAAEERAAAQTTAQSPHESTVPGCNISACETHYPKSFRASDCTYQPNIGPRRLCRK
jgi:hypothetical protein